jgi:ubiquinone/menaquinone biosynthesis C-methylase UbiE
MNETNTANSDQVAYWNEQGGRTWAELNDLLDRQIRDAGLKGIAALAPAPGERILDVGCGGGQTSLALASRVGPQGAVTGADISRPMLELARKRAEGSPNLRFVEADAQVHDFGSGGFDAVFSRFGVMFFADPAAAFTNLRRALRAGGRMVFVCWAPLAENPWMSTPMIAAAKHLPGGGAPPQPDAPGPFAFADPDRVRGVLQAAGFGDIGCEKVTLPIGGNSLEESLTLALRVGPLGARLREAPELAPKVAADVRAALEARLQDGAVWMDGAVWIVSARSA